MNLRLPTLLLPRPRLQFDADGVRFLDPVRRTWIRMTPEEWVRQHVIEWLLTEVGVPAGLMEVERGHDSSGQARRTDVRVTARDGCLWMIVECKAPEVALSQSTLDQVGRYAATLNPEYLATTNGKALHVARRNEAGGYQFVREMPLFPAPRTSDPT